MGASSSTPKAPTIKLSSIYRLPIEHVLKLEFDRKKAFRGQLGPSVPKKEDVDSSELKPDPAAGASWKRGDGDEGPFLVGAGKIIVQRGPFGSIWLRLVDSAKNNAQLLSNFAAYLVQELNLYNSEKKEPNDRIRLAIYVCIREKEMQGADFGVMHHYAFEFYHAREFDRLHHTALDHQGSAAPGPADSASTGVGYVLHDENAKKAKRRRSRNNRATEITRANTERRRTRSQSLTSGRPTAELSETSLSVNVSAIRAGAPADEPLATDRTDGTSSSGHGFKDAPEFVYYCWVGAQPAVPPYATSIEGATGIIFSPAGGDGNEVNAAPRNGSQPIGENLLLVWERGAWNTPGGAVERAELKYEGLKREVLEEVGAKLDDNFNPVYLGGWQAAGARDRRINDNFSVFAVRAASTKMNADGVEIKEALWLPWKPMYEQWKAHGDSKKQGHPKKVTDLSELKEFAHLAENRRIVSSKLMGWLHTYMEGRGLDCKVKIEEASTKGGKPYLTKEIEIGTIKQPSRREDKSLLA